jgi:hypothetical protein
VISHASISRTSVAEPLASHPLFLALAEGLRWWLNFDGPQRHLCLTQAGKLTRADVRRIALNYNFARNLPSEDQRIDDVAYEINRFSGKTWSTLDARAIEIEKTILKIKAIGATNVHIVSGATKLTWFVSPTNWTPFDRLAAAAVGARNVNLLARMRAYYRTLDERGYLRAASAICRHLDAEDLGAVGGERVLDKLLMMNSPDDKAAQGFRYMARAFPAALSSSMRTSLIRVGEAIVSDPACRFELP